MGERERIKAKREAAEEAAKTPEDRIEDQLWELSEPPKKVPTTPSPMATAANFILTLTVIIGLLFTANNAGWITFELSPSADRQQGGIEDRSGDKNRIHSEWLDPTPEEFSPNEVAGQYRAPDKDERLLINVTIGANSDPEVHIGSGYGRPARTETYTFDPNSTQDWAAKSDDYAALFWSRISGDHETTIIGSRELDFDGYSRVTLTRIPHDITTLPMPEVWLLSK